MRASSRLLPILVCAAGMAWADSGTVQLQKQAGPFIITLFSQPTPIRVGRVDLSVLCQESSDRKAVLNGQVILHLRRPGSSEIVEYTLPATRSGSENGDLYVASVNLPSAGRWAVRVDVRRGKDEASVSGTLPVLASQPAVVAYWPFFVAVPLIALLFAINLRLRRGREMRHPRAAR